MQNPCKKQEAECYADADCTSSMRDGSCQNRASLLSGKAMHGYKDRLSASLHQHGASVGGSVDTMLHAGLMHMSTQNMNLLVGLQQAVDKVNEGRIWNRDTLNYFLARHGDEAHARVAERAKAMQQLKQKFDEIDHLVKMLEEELAASEMSVLEIRESVEARMARFYVDMSWEKRIKFSEWRMVKERAMFNMQEVEAANGPRVLIDKLQKRVCSRDERFHTDCVDVDLAVAVETPIQSDTTLMEGNDLDGNIYAEFDLGDRWDSDTNVQICNATCYGLLDPCESPVLAAIFQLQCSGHGDNWIDLGDGYCRDQDDVKPNGYHKKLASRSICGCAGPQHKPPPPRCPVGNMRNFRPSLTLDLAHW